MNIKWHGLSAFTIRHKDVKVIVNPHMVDLDPEKNEAKIVLIGDDKEIKSGDFQQFSWPGEYEANNVSIQIISFGGKNILVFEIDGIKFCHLGEIDEKPTSEIFEKIGDVDVLLVPIGNEKKMLDFKEAIDVMEEIEPKCVIPMNYKAGKYGEDLASNEAFLKEVGLSNVQEQDNYSIKSLPNDKTEYVVLKPKA